MHLGLDDDDLSTCVACGLCLPHCPTYRVTGEEGYSPRGRIETMRAVQWRDAPVDATVVDFIETCVQCRGCEPACPSGVPYGRLIEQTRHALADAGHVASRWQQIAMWPLAHHRVLLAVSTMLAAAQRVRLVPRRFGLGPLPLRRGPAIEATGTDAWLFTGCVMDAWQRDVHRDTARVLDALEVGYSPPGAEGACCGALHVHAGLNDRARSLASQVMRSMPGIAPILVNSAGCGAALQDYGRLLGTEEAAEFSRRVVDVHTFVTARLGELAFAPSARNPVIVQDPCHLRHVQRAHLAVRSALAPFAETVELDDDGLCCGAGGAYSALQPELARGARDRKLEAIDRAASRSGSRVVVSANPGCSIHLASSLADRGIAVRHPMSVIADALVEGPM